nr:hypothetical protein [Tanacetum cinerariifolium]
MGTMRCLCDSTPSDWIHLHMEGSYYLFPCLSISEGKDNKTPKWHLDVPTTSRKSGDLCGLTSNTMRQLPLEISHQEEFEGSSHDSPQSSPQVLPPFEVYTPPVTNSEEVEETIGIPMEVETLNHTILEDLGLKTCSHDIFLSSREIPSVDEPEPQILPNFSPSDINLRDKRGPDPPIKPHSPDSFRMKVVEKSTINIPPSPHMASFHPKDTYCYYHPCIDDPKKHYGFKPVLLGQIGS